MRFLTLFLFLNTFVLSAQVNWAYQDATLNQGESVSLPFYVSGFENIAGFQFSLKIDPVLATLDSIPIQVSNISHFSEECFSWYGKPEYELEEGEVRAAWLYVMGDTLPDNTHVFSLKFKVNQSTTICDLIQVTDNLYPVAYTPQLQQVTLNLNCLPFLNTAEQENEIKIYPNPTYDVVNVNHFARVYNSIGQLTYEGDSPLQLTKGINHVVIKNKTYTVIKL